MVPCLPWRKNRKLSNPILSLCSSSTSGWYEPAGEAEWSRSCVSPVRVSARSSLTRLLRCTCNSSSLWCLLTRLHSFPVANDASPVVAALLLLLAREILPHCDASVFCRNCTSSFFFITLAAIREIKIQNTYVSKVGLLVRFLRCRDVRGELGDQNGPAARHRTGQFGELAQTLFQWETISRSLRNNNDCEWLVHRQKW